MKFKLLTLILLATKLYADGDDKISDTAKLKPKLTGSDIDIIVLKKMKQEQEGNFEKDADINDCVISLKNKLVEAFNILGFYRKAKARYKRRDEIKKIYSPLEYKKNEDDDLNYVEENGNENKNYGQNLNEKSKDNFRKTLNKYREEYKEFWDDNQVKYSEVELFLQPVFLPRTRLSVRDNAYLGDYYELTFDKIITEKQALNAFNHMKKCMKFSALRRIFSKDSYKSIQKCIDSFKFEEDDETKK